MCSILTLNECRLYRCRLPRGRWCWYVIYSKDLTSPTDPSINLIRYSLQVSRMHQILQLIQTQHWTAIDFSTQQMSSLSTEGYCNSFLILSLNRRSNFTSIELLSVEDGTSWTVSISWSCWQQGGFHLEMLLKYFFVAIARDWYKINSTATSLLFSQYFNFSHRKHTPTLMTSMWQ